MWTCALLAGRRRCAIVPVEGKAAVGILGVQPGSIAWPRRWLLLLALATAGFGRHAGLPFHQVQAGDQLGLPDARPAAAFIVINESI